MFPETFAEKWISELVPPGATILDPFCGRGTAPFQALLMGRRAIACDVNPVAYCVTRAKTDAPPASSVRRRLSLLEALYREGEQEAERSNLPLFFTKAYHAITLRQLVFLRERLNWRTSATDCMLAALALGSLHGECSKSQAYFSNQMPRTISPKPGYSVRYWAARNLRPPRRNVFEIIRQRIGFRYESKRPKLRGTTFCADMRELPRLLRDVTDRIRYVITSPPYFDVTDFEEDQWLRLWFLGSDPRPTYGKFSRDDRHSSLTSYWNMICDLWRVLGQILGGKSHVILRIGGKNQRPERLCRSLLAASKFSRRTVRLIGGFEVSPIRRRQTDSFRPGSEGCLAEVDFHFLMT
jgi:hypothetical protein